MDPSARIPYSNLAKTVFTDRHVHIGRKLEWLHIVGLSLYSCLSVTVRSIAVHGIASLRFTCHCTDVHIPAGPTLI